MTKNVLTWCLVALLAGCSSAVKLDNTPVEDRTGAPVQQSANTPRDGGSVTTGGAGTTRVEPVNLNKGASDTAMPAGARVIYFDYDSFAINPEFQSIIETQARYLKTEKTRKFTIEGHTDERGGREYNLALGQKRAEAVKQALALLGVNDAQVEAVSFGKEKPAAEGGDEASLAKNRRAEIAYR